MARTFTVFEVANTDAARGVAIPSPVLAGEGAEILVKDTSGGAGTNNITITPDVGLIDGAGAYDIASDSGFVMLRSDGISWLVIGTSEVSGGGGIATSVANVGQVTVTATGAGNDVTITAADKISTLSNGDSVFASQGNQYLSANENGTGSGTLVIVNQKTGDNNIQFTPEGSISLHSTDGPEAIVIQPSTSRLIAEHDGVGSAQHAAIPNASGGAVIDAEGRAAINALLAYFRLRGSIAT